MIIAVVLSVSPAPAKNEINCEQLAQSYERAQETVENILNWNPEEPIKFDTQSRKEFENYVQKNFRRIFPPAKLETLQSKLYLLGFLPEDYSLQDDLTRLYRDQAGAYYHPEKEMIFVIPGNLPRQSLYFVMVHELVHAYQDRKLNMGKLRKHYQTRRSSFDRKLVFGFLIEGHANLISVASLFPGGKLNERFFHRPAYRTVFNVMAQFSRVSPSELRSLGQLLGGGLRSNFRSQLAKLKDTPHFLVQTLMDPYLLGQKIWFKRASHLGWARAQDWFREPPNSTYEFLYPMTNNTVQKRNPLRLGGYVLLRWTNQLQERPKWGRSVTGDTATIGTNGNRNYLKWVISFDSTEPKTQFLNDLEKLTSAEVTQGRTTELKNTYTKKPRFVVMCTSNQKITLFLSDNEKLKQSCG